MTTYSDDKNPYKQFPHCGIMENHNHHIFKEGYLAAEKDLGFTDIDKATFRYMFKVLDHVLVDDEIQSLKKKVLGE